MTYALNYGPNGRMWPMLGYPLELCGGGDRDASGYIPRDRTTVTAKVHCETRCDIHLALYQAPLLPAGSDSLLLAQADLVGVTGVEQALIVKAPPFDGSESILKLTNPDFPSEWYRGQLTAGSTTLTLSGEIVLPQDGSWDGLEIRVGGSPWYPIDHIGAISSGFYDAAITIPAIASVLGVLEIRVPPPAGYIVRIWADGLVHNAVEVTRLEAAAVSTSGTVSTTRGSNVITGSSTAFGYEWAGYTLTIGSQTFVVSEVVAATRLLTVEVAAATAAGAAYSVTSRAGVETSESPIVYVTSMVVS